MIQLLTSLFGSLGFALLFHVCPGHLLSASAGGMLVWGAYSVLHQHFGTLFLPSLIASALAAVYAEMLARIQKAPANQYLIVGLIPLVPGSSLYYTAASLAQSDLASASRFGFETAQYSLGIAAGISLTWAGMDMLRKLFPRS